MKKVLTAKNILLAVMAILIIGQFFPINKTNPVVEAEKDMLLATNAPEPIAKLVQNACYDCHSHQTQYPWYSSVFPVSRFVGGHVKNGRKKLNFSQWTDYSTSKQQQEFEECVEAIETNWMPMKTFVFMHPEAKMTDEEKTMLANWFKSQASGLN